MGKPVRRNLGGGGPPHWLIVDGLFGHYQHQPLPLELLDRASNPEIAEQLVIAVRTVETHLYRVFKKLGVGERERLADLLD